MRTLKTSRNSLKWLGHAMTTHLLTLRLIPAHSPYLSILIIWGDIELVLLKKATIHLLVQ
jgi:hypothetical protein